MHPLLKNYFDLIKKFIPESAPGTSVGIDIGSSECKLVEISFASGEFELLNMATEPLLNGDASAPIKKLLEKLETPPKRIYTSVSGKGTLVRFIDLPRMSREELSNSFSLEADKYFPFSLDHIYTDCYITDPQGKNKQMKVIAVAAKKELVDDRLKLVQNCGVNADFIGINSLAVANAFNVLGPGEECPPDAVNIAILDIGDSLSNLTIMDQKMPCFSRDIFIGAREFTKNISNAFKVSSNEAEMFKLQPGEKLEEVHTAIEYAVLNLVKEIRLSFDYFATEYNKEVKVLLLTGGGAMLTGLDKTMGNMLEIKVLNWNPLLALKPSPNVQNEYIRQNGTRFGVALGLALYDYD
jgi:type IV pilus assembly protein PilM